MHLAVVEEMFGSVSQGSCEISTSHGARPFDKNLIYVDIKILRRLTNGV